MSYEAWGDNDDSPYEAAIEAGWIDLADQTKALIDVMKERARQQSEEGWTFDHDDTHIQGELAAAAACYALWASDVAPLDGLAPPTSDKVMQFWPFAPAWFKVQFRRTALIKAGALILAELDRLDRKYRTEEEPF